MIATIKCSALSFFNTLCIIVVLLSFKLDHFVNGQRVKLTDVQVLTLSKDRFTTGRRSGGVPQLKCIGSYYKCQQFSPNTVQCYNKGHDGIDVQWECKADLDKRIKFGILKVSCEGFEYPTDPFILAGSCGLEYSLESSSKSSKNYNEFYHKELYETNKWSNFLTLLIMAVIVLAVYKSCTKNRENDHMHDFNSPYLQVPTSGVDTTYVSSGGGSVFPPPPPPYGFAAPTSSANPSSAQQNPPATGFKPEYMSGAEQGAQFSHASNANSQTGNGGNTWGSFLTGAAIGGIGGYFLNRRGNDSPNWTETTRRSESPPPAYEEDRASGFASTTRR